jgi:hypothetical protein
MWLSKRTSQRGIKNVIIGQNEEHELTTKIRGEHELTTKIRGEHELTTKIRGEHELTTKIRGEHELTTKIRGELKETHGNMDTKHRTKRN